MPLLLMHLKKLSHLLYFSYKKMLLSLNNFNICFPTMLQQGSLTPYSCFNLQSYSRKIASTFLLIQVGARNQPTIRRCNFNFSSTWANEQWILWGKKMKKQSLDQNGALKCLGMGKIYIQIQKSDSWAQNTLIPITSGETEAKSG